MIASKVAVATTIAAVMAALVAWVVQALLENEVRGLCDWLARWLVQAAGRKLPLEDQARWDEEWRDHLGNLPTPLTRLAWAASIFFYAAPRQARLLQEVRGVSVAVGVRSTPFAMSSIVAVTIVMVFITWMVLGIGGERTRSIVHAIALSGASLGACVACFHAACRKPLGFGRAWTASQRRAWRLLGAAALSWALGELYCAYSHIVNSIELHFPSPIDFGYVSAAPLLVAGVLAFPVGPVATTARLRTMLDGLMIVASLLFLCWAIVLGDAYRAGDSSALGQAFSLAYPLGDVVAGAMALLLLTNSRGRGRAQLRMIAVAVLALAISDSSYIYLSQTGAYTVGVLDTGWLIGWLLLMVSALKPTVAALHRTDNEEERSRVRLPLLFIPVVLAAVTGLMVQILKGSFEPFLVFTGMTIGLLLVARQVIIVIENHQLSARLKAIMSQQPSQRD